MTLTRRDWRCGCKAVLTAVVVLSSSSTSTSSDAFVSPRLAHGRIRRRARMSTLSMSSSDGDNLIYNPSSSSHANANAIAEDEDYVYVSPTNVLYTGDPRDQPYSASDWLANVKSLPRSTILRAIQGPVVSVMVWSLLVSVIHGTLQLGSRTRWMANAMCLSSKPHSFLVSALGLLLVFRTNSAYQRFAEGRKIWENIHSISRSMSRLACLYERDLGSQRKHRIFRLLGAFPYLLHHHIQPQCLNPSDYTLVKGTKFAIKLQDGADLCRTEIKTKQRDNNGNVVAYLAQTIRRLRARKQRQPFSAEEEDEDIYCGLDGDDCKTCLVDRRSLPWCLLPPAALRKCADSDNRPLWVCDRLSKEFTTVRYSDNFTSRERLAFLSQIDKLSKCIGECERIHQTAVPLNYARHSLRSLTIWLFSLPFTLVSEFGVLTAPVMGVISWLLFGVYQIGSTIEDPFQGSLRLSILCDAIFRDVMYDADMKNQRDSAFQLEAELYEWNNEIVPIRAAGQQVLALPIINGSGVLNLTASAGTNSAVEDVSSDTEPHSQSTTPTSSASTTDDPMQPRP